MVKTRIEVFPDIAEHIDFFEKLPEYDVAMYTHKKMKTNAETSLEVLTEILPRSRGAGGLQQRRTLCNAAVSMLQKRVSRTDTLCGQSVPLSPENR